MDNKDKLKYKIINLREQFNWTQAELAEKMNLGLDNTKINKIEKGHRKVTTEELNRFAELFNVSTDYLLGRKSKENYYNLNDKEKNDIAKQADNLLKGIETGSDLNFYGEPATEEQKERLRVAIRTAMEMNKEESKKKFTPKKYRD